ncbi:MAG: Fe(2+) transporter permease subunit FeoB [Alphaproteobacteria bacterium]
MSLKKIKIALIGNPNCGKTTLFNALTGARQKVGNWPGVTVERKIGTYTQDEKEVEVTDLPGVYSLTVSSSTSLDERIASDFILEGKQDLVVNILDASNIDRGLYLTTQLLDMGVPIIVVLNMMDIASSQNMDLRLDVLSKMLGCPVIPLIANKKDGICEFMETVNFVVAEDCFSGAVVRLDKEIEVAVAALKPMIKGTHKRWDALQVLEGISVSNSIKKTKIMEQQIDTMKAVLDEYVDILLTKARYCFIQNILEKALERKEAVKETFSDKVDRFVLNRFLGVPIFLFVMYLLFFFTMSIGGAFIDFFDMFAGTIFVDSVENAFEALGIPSFLTLLVVGAGQGIQTVATFIPILGCLYLFLSFLEGSGYMARAAFVMDRFMRVIGLPGKAFVSLVMGFGCNVPAFMSGRTLESVRDRAMVTMMIPFMSCGAKLPVYILFGAAFFPDNAQNIVFLLYFIGIFVALLTGVLMKKTLLQGAKTPFLMEIPAYNLPPLKNVLIDAWHRVRIFIFGAGKIIVPVVMVLSILSAVGQDGSFGKENTQDSLLSGIGRGIVPLFEPMGMREDNWPAAVGVFTGIFAKEVVVGTLDALYTGMDAVDQSGAVPADAVAFSFWGGIRDALQTIPSNLSSVGASLLDPLGLSVGEVDDIVVTSEAQGVSVGVFGAMQRYFDGGIGAFAYLLFILLYSPCVAAIAAVYRELGMRWMLMVAGWSTGVAYTVAVLFYQFSTFEKHPLSALLWAVGSFVFWWIFLLFFKSDSGKKMLVLDGDGAIGCVSTSTCKTGCCS